MFEYPRDLHSFQLCASPDGLSCIKSLAIAYGPGGYLSCCSLFRDVFYVHGFVEHSNRWLHELENAIHGLKEMDKLRKLDIWFGYTQIPSFWLSHRPWDVERGGKGVEERINALEQRHQKILDLFGTLEGVADFTLHLTWNPEDVVSQRKWAFEVKVYELREMERLVVGGRRYPRQSVVEGLDLLGW